MNYSKYQQELLVKYRQPTMAVRRTKITSLICVWLLWLGLFFFCRDYQVTPAYAWTYFLTLVWTILSVAASIYAAITVACLSFLKVAPAFLIQMFPDHPEIKSSMEFAKKKTGLVYVKYMEGGLLQNLPVLDSLEFISNLVLTIACVTYYFPILAWFLFMSCMLKTIFIEKIKQHIYSHLFTMEDSLEESEPSNLDDLADKLFNPPTEGER